MSSLELKPVKRVLESLDKTDRYIVMLYYADGLTLPEIALVLDLPTPVVQSVINRLRGRLMDAVEREGRAASEPPFMSHAPRAAVA